MKQISLSLSPRPVFLPEGEGSLQRALGRLADDKVISTASYSPPESGGLLINTVDSMPLRHVAWMKRWRNPKLAGLFTPDSASSIQATLAKSTALGELISYRGL